MIGTYRRGHGDEGKTWRNNGGTFGGVGTGEPLIV